MIVTVTPNPSVDRTATLEEFRRGEVLRATSMRLDPGGKGVNVARALAAAGTPTVALLPAGGPEGDRLAELLAPEGVPVVALVVGTLISTVAVILLKQLKASASPTAATAVSATAVSA